MSTYPHKYGDKAIMLLDQVMYLLNDRMDWASFDLETMETLEECNKFLEELFHNEG